MILVLAALQGCSPSGDQRPIAPTTQPAGPVAQSTPYANSTGAEPSPRESLVPESTTQPDPAQTTTASSGHTEIIRVDPWAELGAPDLTSPDAVVVAGCSQSDTRAGRLDCAVSETCMANGTDYGAGVWCLRGAPDEWIPAWIEDEVFSSAVSSELPGADPLELALTDGRTCGFFFGAGPYPPEGYGGWAGTCGWGASLGDDFFLWYDPPTGGVDPDPSIFVSTNGSYLQVAVGPENEAPQIVDVAIVYY